MLARALSGVIPYLLAAAALQGQVIEFESGGLKYQTLTRNGVTVMYAVLPSHVREYAIIQVAVQNGSKTSWNVAPEQFRFVRSDGAAITASPARTVVGELIEKGTRNDVVKMITRYEQGLYGLTRANPSNSYEQRRQSAIAMVSSAKLKAAAAASAIALVFTRLAAGQSTDGAVFFQTDGKPLGSGKLVVSTAGTVFEFDSLALPEK